MGGKRIRSGPAALALGAAMLTAGVGLAADHLDAPGTARDPAADINDVYVFRSREPGLGNLNRTVFVMTVFPNATLDSRFSEAVTYEFRVRERGTENFFNIVCNAAGGEAQMITCTGPGDVTDTVPFGAVEAGDPFMDNMRIFAGLRDDPFFFDLDAFNAVVADPAQIGQLVDDEGTDFFRDFGALTIVVDVNNIVFRDSTLLEVQGVTTRNGLDRAPAAGGEE